MNRKNFMRKAGIGVGASLLTGITGYGMNSQSDQISTTNDPKIIRDQEGKVLDVIGDVQTHKLVGSETKDLIVEWVDNVDPGVGIPPHFHRREDEIFRVIYGQVEIMVDGETTILEGGDIAFAPRNIPHSWKVIGTEKARMITSALPAGIEYMFEELARLPKGPPDFEKVAAICSKYGVSFV
jgi:quercetin dioxygenase-like cupin family protein